MWIKISGACLIILAGSAMGFRIAKRYSERPQQIREFISCLSALQSYIVYAALPLNEALRCCADGVEGIVATIFRRTGELMSNNPALTPEDAFAVAQAELGQYLTFQKAEQELIRLFSTHLGMMNRHEQGKKLELIQEQLEALAQEALRLRDSNVKMYRYLGVCGSLAVVIMLV